MATSSLFLRYKNLASNNAKVTARKYLITPIYAYVVLETVIVIGVAEFAYASVKIFWKKEY